MKVLTGLNKFSFLALQRLEIKFGTVSYIVLYDNIGNGSNATIEELSIDGVGIGLKSTIIVNLANSDYVNMEILTINNDTDIAEVSYDLRSPDNIGLSSYNTRITHAGNIKANLLCKTTESDYNIMQLSLTVIDGKRHITDVATSIAV